MFTHEDIWRGLDRLADAFGYSPSGLAKKAGLDPTSFNKSKRRSPDGKPRWPSTESLAKVLSVTGASMSEFISLIGGDGPGQPEKGQRIPVLGFAQAGRAGYFDADGYPAGDGWDQIVFPDAANADDVFYALKVSGNSMEPLYRAGDLLIVSPAAPLRRGDRIVVKTRGGEVMVKQLSRQNAARIELQSLNPDFETLTLPRADIALMGRIMWVSQ